MDGYKGVNSTWRDPATGQSFEVQFHTRESLAAKEAEHHLYEAIRKLPKDSPIRMELHAKSRAIYRDVPIPPGAADVMW